MTDPTPTRDETVRAANGDNRPFPNYEVMPDPTDEMLAIPQFEAIWNVIKSWDVNVPEAYSGYCGANGSHVAMILKALASAPAHASGRVDAVAVKALEWVCEPLENYAKTPFGRYRASHDGYWSGPNHVDGDEDSIVAAKAAAQADYEQRIRSALSPAATPVSEAGGELPVIPDDDADFTPDLARKIIAGYQRLLLAKPASSPAGGDVVPGLRAEIAHDGFSGDIIGRYVTREGKRGAVVQQDGTRVVHVYGEKWLPVETQIALSQSTSAGRVGE